MKKLNLKNIEPNLLGASKEGKDSLIEHVFDCIGTTNKFCVEFGGHDGFSASTILHLTRDLGWTGCMFEKEASNPHFNMYQEFLTKENICSIFKSHNIPEKMDFLSVDVDGNDFWLLSSLLKEFKPRFIVVEANVRFGTHDRWMIRYDPNFAYFNTNHGKGWYGTSPKIMKELGEKFGYTTILVLCDDVFMVRKEELHPDDINILWEEIYPYLNGRPELYESHQDPVKNESIWMNLGIDSIPE